MSVARNDFISRIRTLKKSITQTDATQTKAPTEQEHNEIARMLRNGLAVVGFASLEDFIKSRCAEVLDEIGQANLPFSNLPLKLQSWTTYEAIKAINYQLGLRDALDKATYAQSHAEKIASTTNAPYSLTPLAFGFGQANLNDELIKKILKVFNIENPWAQIDQISSSLGLTASPLMQSFKNGMARRHKAAHVASEDTPQNDIDQFVTEAIAVAIGFDFLISKALKMLKNHDSSFLDGSCKISFADVDYRFIKFLDNKWKEYKLNSSHAYRVSEDLDNLILDAKSRCMTQSQYFVLYDNVGLIKDWDCF